MLKPYYFKAIIAIKTEIRVNAIPTTQIRVLKVISNLVSRLSNFLRTFSISFSILISIKVKITFLSFSFKEDSCIILCIPFNFMSLDISIKKKRGFYPPFIDKVNFRFYPWLEIH